MRGPDGVFGSTAQTGSSVGTGTVRGHRPSSLDQRGPSHGRTSKGAIRRGRAGGLTWAHRVRRVTAAGASFIRCCHAAYLIPSVDSLFATAPDLRTSERATAWPAVEMSRKLSRFFAKPACIPGVRVTLPNGSESATGAERWCCPVVATDFRWGCGRSWSRSPKRQGPRAVAESLLPWPERRRRPPHHRLPS